MNPNINFKTTSFGYELIFANTELYSGRILIIKEAERLPYLYHKKQSLTIFVLQGNVLLTIEGKNKVLNEGDSYYIQHKIMYRVSALKNDATVLECGTQIQDDIVLVEK